MNLKYVGSVTLSLVAVACIALGVGYNASTLGSDGAKIDAAQPETPQIGTAGVVKQNNAEIITNSAARSFGETIGEWLAGLAIAIIGIIVIIISVFGKKIWNLGKRITTSNKKVVSSDSSLQPPVDVARLPDGENRENESVLKSVDNPNQSALIVSSVLNQQSALPASLDLRQLTSDDFQIWQFVAQSRNLTLVIESQPAAVKASAMLRPRYSTFRETVFKFNELSDASDVVTIDYRPLQYTPVVIDQSLTRLCNAGVLQRGEWKGSRRVYALLVPCGDFERPGL